jgi:alpha-L-fucosidase
LPFRRTEDALEVELPDRRPSALGPALRITLADPEPRRRTGWLHN